LIYHVLDVHRIKVIPILNGRCAEDAGIGKYTFIGSRGCSLVDYVLGSESIFDLISSFTVHDPNSLSDHCLIDCTFENSVSIGTTDLVCEVNIENENYEEVSSKYKWKSQRLDSFINAINENVCVVKINTLTSFINTCASQGDDVNDSLTQFSVLMQTVTEDLFKTTVQHNDDISIKTQPGNNPWFKDECCQYRDLFYHS